VGPSGVLCGQAHLRLITSAREFLFRLGILVAMVEDGGESRWWK
jgi:hypothetical protein